MEAKRKRKPRVRVDVLCQCGWGRLCIEVESVPSRCPMCGYSFLAVLQEKLDEEAYPC